MTRSAGRVQGSARTLDKPRRGKLAIHLALIAGALIMMVPLLWMLTTSLKTTRSVHLPPYLLPTEFAWSNYIEAWRAADFARFYINSGVMTVGIVGGQLLFSSLAGYAFARLKFPGRNLLFFLVLATMMVPLYVTLIPSYLIVRWLGWLDSYQGLIAPRLVSAFGIFLMRQFYLSIPSELEEAALMDGASRLRIWWSIALPLSMPALATLGIFAFLFSWNDFLWPLIVTSSAGMRTVQLGLAEFTGRYGTRWTLLTAGSLTATLPAIIAFLIGQRWLVRGIRVERMK
ncbi:MAG: carbohydrate ABC transporter permease [Actinobacteria bacterium]|nr:carbohydrate ABC transporter permease [Actinomycetota bacterium]